MDIESRVQSRRAIEALRAGVPNRDAVQALGSTQYLLSPKGEIAAEELFKQQLQSVLGRTSQEDPVPGLLIGGNFGSGKSHLLEYLQHIALENNFVCSKVVVSKETPLYDPAKVFSAAVRSGKLPDDRIGAALTNVAFKLRFDSPEYASLFHWINQPGSGLNTRFAATLCVFEHGGKLSPEVSDRIIQFWSGERIANPELRAWLRELGEAATYRIDKVTVKDLAAQRYRFVPRLMVAAGYAGWVILVDEVELIGQYSLRRRAQSYAELARLLGRLKDGSPPGLTSVVSINQGYVRQVLDDPRKRDEEKIPAHLSAGSKGDDQLLVSQAERGMRTIREEMLQLEPPTKETLRQIYEKVRDVYAGAYGWEPPPDYKVPDPSRRIRQHIKTWINEWDLKRLYPDYEPETQVTELEPSYEEMRELEVQGEDGEDDTVPH